jgi:hypothetical protein
MIELVLKKKNVQDEGERMRIMTITIRYKNALQSEILTTSYLILISKFTVTFTFNCRFNAF